jgi:DNA-binding MarR family transcriptional regulator
VTNGMLANQCAKAVMETVPQIMRAIREEMRQRGAPFLSVSQLRTLAFLHHSPGSCLYHLAEHLGVARPTASAIVGRLVQRGMVSRTENPTERRRVSLKLTPLGARHFRQTRQSAQSCLTSTLSRLSPARLRRITQGVRLLGEPFKCPVSGPVGMISHGDLRLAKLR